MNPAEIGRPAPQRHLIWMYFGFVVQWGMSVDHAQALLRDHGYLKWLSAAVICALALTVLRKAAGRINVWGISTPLCLLILWVVLSGIVNSSSVTHTLVSITQARKPSSAAARLVAERRKTKLPTILAAVSRAKKRLRSR